MDGSGLGYGGEREIRTLETLTRPPVFETGAFNHSATSPTGLFILNFRTNETRISLIPCNHVLAKNMGTSPQTLYRHLQNFNYRQVLTRI